MKFVRERTDKTRRQFLGLDPDHSFASLIVHSPFLHVRDSCLGGFGVVKETDRQSIDCRSPTSSRNHYLANLS
jgi:hypothetical protein